MRRTLQGDPRARAPGAWFGVPLGRAPCGSGSIEADLSGEPRHLPIWRSMRRLLLILGLLAIVAVVVIGLTQAGGASSDGGPGYDLKEAKQKLEGAPPPLAELHAQASTLIGGGKPAFEQRLAS